MTDNTEGLIERLRKYRGGDTQYRKLMDEAANEIARLKTAGEAMAEAARKVLDTCESEGEHGPDNGMGDDFCGVCCALGKLTDALTLWTKGSTDAG